MRKIKVAVLVGLLIVAAGVVWVSNYLFWFGPSLPNVDWREAMSELQAECAGVEIDDLRGYEALVELGELFEEIADSGVKKPESFVPSSWKDPEAEAVIARQWLDACQAKGVFDVLERLAGLPGYVHLWDAPTLRETEYLEQLSSYRLAIRTGSLRARYAVEEGDPDAAANSVELQISLAELMLPQPIAFKMLLGNGVLSLAISDTKKFLATDGLSSEQLDRLSDRYGAVELSNLRDAYQGEYIIAVDMLSNTLLSDRSLRVTSPAAQAAYIKQEYDRAYEWVQLSVSARRSQPYLPLTDDWRYLPASIFSVYSLKKDSITTELDGIRLILAVERFRRSTGEIPGKLTELLPEYLESLPMDRFADVKQPYRYRVLDTPDEKGREYHLYSIGYDGVDNGGTEPEERPHEALSPESAGTDFMLHRFE